MLEFSFPEIAPLNSLTFYECSKANKLAQSENDFFWIAFIWIKNSEQNWVAKLKKNGNFQVTNRQFIFSGNIVIEVLGKRRWWRCCI